MRLLPANLAQLNGNVAVPSYDRSEVRPGILHIGIGNFHRAHQAVYTDDLLAAGGDPDWGIAGAGVRPEDVIMRQNLQAQEWLSTVVETDGTTLAARVTGAMVDFVPVELDHAPLIRAISDPVTKIVSMTITEGGYFIDAATGGFDAKDPQILADFANPDRPTTFFGALLAGLRARRDAGLPVTVMSCDNLPGNGTLTRQVVTDHAKRSHPDLVDWIETNVSFPNAMVDRITPATSEREINLVRETFGIEYRAPVFCEPFRQWVIEDDFSAGRPDWAEVGVTLTPHVHEYEAMKIRVLNGGHAVLAYAAGMLDIKYVHEAMDNGLVERFLHRTESQEILPHVKPIGLLSPAEYLDQTTSRFRNPGVADTIRRLCFDGSNRQPKFILPSVADCLKQGIVPTCLATVSALWARYCLGETESGIVIDANDPSWAARQNAARGAVTDPVAWLRQTDIYGDLADSEIFSDAFVSAYQSIRDDGVAAALERCG